MDNFINFANENMTVCTGEYYAVDKNEFEEVIKTNTDEKGVIFLPRSYSKKNILVYLADSYNCLKKGSFVLMPKKMWIAAKQTKGKHAGEDLNVYSNGTIWTYKPNKKALVFVRKDKQ